MLMQHDAIATTFTVQCLMLVSSDNLAACTQLLWLLPGEAHQLIMACHLSLSLLLVMLLSPLSPSFYFANCFINIRFYDHL